MTEWAKRAGAKVQLAGATLALGLVLTAVGCGGTGSGGAGHPGASSERQFVLNSNDFGQLILNVSPATVNANKTDRMGLVAVLTDAMGVPVAGVTITFSSDVSDVSFIPGFTSEAGVNFGTAITGANGTADIIAVAGSQPTASGPISGIAALTASAPVPFSLTAMVSVTLVDVGFINADALTIIPASITLVEPVIGQVLFFNIVGGTPPYLLKNESSGLGFAAISQHCVPGCTENTTALCIGSPCQADSDCNSGGSSTPAGVCLGPIKRCIATCTGPNCAGSRCATDSDCNDGDTTPAGVCADSGQAIAYTIIGDAATGNVAEGQHIFTVEDSAGISKDVTVESQFDCGNGVARGNEVCDLGDLRGLTCATVGFPFGGDLRCADDCSLDTSGCISATPTPAPTP